MSEIDMIINMTVIMLHVRMHISYHFASVQFIITQFAMHAFDTLLTSFSAYEPKRAGNDVTELSRCEFYQRLAL